MIVKPGIFGHPKFLAFKKRVGGPALEYLCRLWGHCEENHKWVWPEADGGYVEALCSWKGPPGKLFAILVECRWVKVSPDGLMIHDWEVANASLITSWRNGAKHRGHEKPRGNPGDTRGLPAGYPQVNPPVTLGQPSGNPAILNGVDREEEVERGSAREGEPLIPTVEEIVTFGAMSSGIPPDYCRHYHERRTIGRSWVSKAHGDLVDWRKDIVSGQWWGKDRVTWVTRAPMTYEPPPEIQKIKAELEWQRDPKKIAALMARQRRIEAS